MAHLPVVDSITVGGRVFTNFTKLKILGASNSAANAYGTFRLGSATSGYQVPVGKKLCVWAWRLSSGTSSGFNIGYGDNDVGYDSAAAPTNFTYAFGSAGMFTGQHDLAGASPAEYEGPTYAEIPASKYPFLTQGSACDMYIFAYLEDA